MAVMAVDRQHVRQVSPPLDRQTWNRIAPPPATGFWPDRAAPLPPLEPPGQAPHSGRARVGSCARPFSFVACADATVAGYGWNGLGALSAGPGL